MGLLELPTELRLAVFSHLPDLRYGRHETIGPNVRLTPAISRTCRSLREETLPLYAQTSFFIIQTDDNDNRVHIWLDALGAAALPKVENLQLSRHWKVTQPSRWQGHVGFYLRLQMIGAVWQCTAGTYPIANDMRGMRLESVDALRHVVMQRLRPPDAFVQRKCLARPDVEFIVAAMEIVAAHPISTYDTDQSEAGRKRRREIWATMEAKLRALRASSSSSMPALTPARQDTSSFHTPY